MNLEDKLGDIIRKDRMAANASAEAAAQAAGISAAELSTLEETGTFSKRPNFIALASTIGLDGKKLEGIANGWLPSEKDLDTWHELRVFTTDQKGMKVNCYLIWDEVS